MLSREAFGFGERRVGSLSEKRTTDMYLPHADNREVRANRVWKPIGAENTFSSELTEFEPILSELQPLIDTV
jgi:nucleotidyltransferase/DNA polymerase involved in DNA repair